VGEVRAGPHPGSEAGAGTMIAAVTTICLFLATNEVDRAKCEYEQRQRDLYCANHPDTCFRPETEVEKAMREYRERQDRVQKR
jgi:hypothetical protein